MDRGGPRAGGGERGTENGVGERWGRGNGVRERDRMVLDARVVAALAFDRPFLFFSILSSINLSPNPSFHHRHSHLFLLWCEICVSLMFVSAIGQDQ